LIDSVFERYASQPFLMSADSGEVLTYAEFRLRSARLAGALARRGVRRGQRVGLMLPNSAELAALYFACLGLGCVAVPIHPTTSERDLQHIQSEAGLSLLVSQPGLELEAPWPDFLAELEPDSAFTITFTSGTTATPKGVVHTVHSLFGNAVAFNGALGLDESHRTVHVMPMTYMAGLLNTLLCPFAAGGSVVLDRAFDARSGMSFWNAARKHEANLFWLSPTMLSALLKLDRDKTALDWCRQTRPVIFVGTAPLGAAVRQRFEERYGLRVQESYGLSELLLLCAQSQDSPDGSVGRLLPGVGLDLAADEEIFLTTPYQMAGYLEAGQPQRRSGPFPTGDLGRLDAAGELYITGRKKDLIIRGGINVSPVAVEQVLAQHPQVEQVAVVGRPDELYGEVVAAFVKAAPAVDWPQLERDLLRLARAQLAPSAVPASLISLDEFPVTTTGKVVKARLRERL